MPNEPSDEFLRDQNELFRERLDLIQKIASIEETLDLSPERLAEIEAHWHNLRNIKRHDEES